MYKGCWITPDGEILDTDNTISHRLAILKCNLLHIIDDKYNNIKWSKTEIKSLLNTDDVICLLKLGYIRILISDLQVGILFESVLNFELQYKSIKTFIQENSNYNIAIVCEKLSTFESAVANDLSDIRAAFNKILSHS